MLVQPSSNRLTVLRCGTGPEWVVDALRRALPEHDLQVCPADRVAEFVAEADVVIPARARITASILALAARCRLIQQMGAGTDLVDIVAAVRQGIPVANVPSTACGAAESVAEHALFLILGVLRNHRPLARAVAASDWSAVPVSRTLTNSTVGIVGVGGIGSALARMLRSFDCRVIGVKRRPDPPLADELGLAWLGGMDDLERMLPEVDILVLTLPLASGTRGLVGAARLALMPPGSYLVNVARSELVDHDALVNALASGHIRGAGLDVFWDEPADPKDPIFEYNIFVTPHAGGYTEMMLSRASALVAANIKRLLTSQPLHHLVSPNVDHEPALHLRRKDSAL